MACQKKEAPAAEEAAETMVDTTMVADTAMVDTSAAE